MHTRAIQVMLLLGSFFTLQAGAEAGEFPRPFEVLSEPVSAPDVSFQSPDGSSVSVRRWQGKVLVLNVWATWCGPCVREIPSLDLLSKRVSNRQIVVIPVSQDKAGLAKASQYLLDRQVKHLEPYVDPSANLSPAFGIRGLPTTFIIDKKGKVRARLEGALEWDSNEVLEALTSIENESE